MDKHNNLIVWMLLRFTMSFILLWAFFDKLLGLNFSTEPGKSWLHGVSPTYGFLKFGVHNPIFQNLAGNGLVDWLFMMGLLLIGAALLLGIGIRIASISGIVLMMLLWISQFPPANNPLVDEHVVYILLFVGFFLNSVGDFVGLGKWWSRTPLVKRFPILK